MFSAIVSVSYVTYLQWKKFVLALAYQNMIIIRRWKNIRCTREESVSFNAWIISIFPLIPLSYSIFATSNKEKNSWLFPMVTGGLIAVAINNRRKRFFNTENINKKKKKPSVGRNWPFDCLPSIRLLFFVSFFFFLTALKEILAVEKQITKFFKIYN